MAKYAGQINLCKDQCSRFMYRPSRSWCDALSRYDPV